ncbi:MAG: DUF4433 domain-containing protein [Spirochaetales bacterium]|jgi:hypothetical protein|nr:DUF4433 domain-containing protein [Spirochaetales bacterium]
MMPDTLYHLTAIANMPNILSYGLISRAKMQANGVKLNKNIADPNILTKRQQLGIFDYVPFHLFPDTAFDYRIKTDNPDTLFAYITIPLNHAIQQHWLYIPCHPLHYQDSQLYDCNNYDFTYAETAQGLREWWVIQRHLNWKSYRQVYMAEVLAPTLVPVTDFGSIVVKDLKGKNLLLQISTKCNIDLNNIIIDPNIFGAGA